MLTPAHHAQLLTDRRMRISPRAEAIARAAVEGMAALQIGFFEEVMRLPYFAGVDMAAIKSVGSAEEHYTCDCHKEAPQEVEKREFHGNAIAGIERLFAEVVGDAQAQRIFTAGRLWKALATGKGSPLGIGYSDMITEAFRWAWGNANSAFNDLPRSFQVATGQPQGGQLMYDAQTAWISKLERNGYKLVSDSITHEMVPKIQQQIINGIRANVPAMQLANELNAYAGSGGLYRVRRLVRTEMAMAIDGATKAQYKSAGIPYVKWNAAANACPVCRRIAENNRGYYAIDGAPQVTQDTHPNCLCNKTPVYRLPQGISI